MDTYSQYASNLESPGEIHYLITPSDVTPIALQPRSLYVSTDGTLIMTDEKGVQVTYNVFAGTIIPFRPVYVNQGTTATVIGWV